jgi:hypothetical protein
VFRAMPDARQRSSKHVFLITCDMFSMVSDPRLYNDSLFVARRLENWNWKFRSCLRRTKRMGCSGVQRSTTQRESQKLVVGKI